MNARTLNNAIDTRALVRIGQRAGWAKGVVGIALGYNANYGTVKVGFVDDEGNYTGDYTKAPAQHVELIEPNNV